VGIQFGFVLTKLLLLVLSSQWNILTERELKYLAIISDHKNFKGKKWQKNNQVF